MENEENKNKINASYWIEKVVIITDDYEIVGSIFMPKTTKKSRLLSELLNSNRKFIAVKDCIVQAKNSGSLEPEVLDFMEINISAIAIVKPYKEYV